MQEELKDVAQVWVTVTEAAQATGYNRQYITRLAQRISYQMEDQREIKIKRYSSGYHIWLPDLIAYMSRTRHGPHPKKTS